jgi:hypothetical protein
MMERPDVPACRTPYSNLAIPWTRLPLRFEVNLLRADLEAIPGTVWVSHFNQNDFVGAWSSISLRSLSGRMDDIQPRGRVADFTDTPLAAQCPYLKAVCDAFDFPKKSVRLLRLHPHSRVREHCDADLALADGEVRIHVPITTDDRAEFVVSNRRLILGAGESWFIDFTQPHRIDNPSDSHRVHLVIDGTANDWALQLIRRAAQELRTETFEPAGLQSFREFRERVLDDPHCQAELLQISDLQEFLEVVLDAGTRLGFRFGMADVESAYLEGRREWFEWQRAL